MEPSLNSVLGVQKINFRQQDFIRDSNQICFPNPQCWDFGSKYLHNQIFWFQIFTHQIFILNTILSQSHASYAMNLKCIYLLLLTSKLLIHLSLIFGIPEEYFYLAMQGYFVQKASYQCNIRAPGRIIR